MNKIDKVPSADLVFSASLSGIFGGLHVEADEADNCQSVEENDDANVDGSIFLRVDE